MRYLSLEQVLELHAMLVARHGGAPGVRDRALVASAVARPMMSFDGSDLYPTLVDKAAALAHSLVNNHAFVDGDKRVGHAALEVFLLLNGHELDADVDESERVMLGVAAGTLSQEGLTAWVRSRVVPAGPREGPANAGSAHDLDPRA